MKNPTPNLFIGLGSAVYALVKTDGQLHKEESIRARLTLIEVPNGEIAMHSFQLREHYQTSVDEAYNLALRCFSMHRKELSHNMKKYFIMILVKIAHADEHLSIKEIAFLRRFKRDIRRV